MKTVAVDGYAGKGGMRQKTEQCDREKADEQKTAGISTVKRNKRKFDRNRCVCRTGGHRIGSYSLAVLPAVRGKYVGDGTVSFRYEGIHSGNAGTGQRLQLSLSDPLQAGGSDPSGHRQSAHRNGTGHGAGNDVAEQRSDDRPENNAGQARGGKVAGSHARKTLASGDPHWNGSGIPVFCVDGISADRDLSPGIKYKYLGVFTPNPFHNATYMAARPFAILAFFKYGELLPVYEQPNAVREHKRDYILFAIYLLLATMTKPSFTIVLVGAAGILMLWRMFRSRFRNFVPTVWLGVCFIPTFMDLLYQFRGVFVPQEGQEGGIGFTFGHVWAQYCGNLPLAIGLAIGFPILVLLLNYKELRRDSIYRFSWQVYVMSFLMAFFLYEKGFREMDFNFSWGYMYGIFFAFVGALLVLLRATANAGTRRKKTLVAVQWLAYLWHLVCGVYYFWGFLQGAMYY